MSDLQKRVSELEKEVENTKKIICLMADTTIKNLQEQIDELTGGGENDKERLSESLA